MAGEDGSGNSGTEGDRRKFTEFEALATEGDADDGNTPEDSRKKHGERKFRAAKDQPNGIGDGVRAEVGTYGGADWPEIQTRHLKALTAEGDPDEGNAPKDTEDEPSNGTDKTGEEKPKNIAERFHEKVILSNQKM